MSEAASCVFCGEMNRLTGGPVYCYHCGHRVDRDRERCDCETCGGLGQRERKDEPTNAGAGS